MTEGVRYPTLAFQTGGAGQADEGIPPQPFETFCYDSALMQAKIENFNVIPYTSVLPKELFGNIVPVDKVVNQFKHGAVLEVIMAGTLPINKQYRIFIIFPLLRNYRCLFIYIRKIKGKGRRLVFISLV